MQPVLTDGRWTPDFSWSEFEGEETDFVAFYPAINGRQQLTEFTIPVDQRSMANYAQADLLFASTSAKKGEKVHLNFSHKMSRLTVELRSNTLSAEVLSKAVLKVPAFNAINVNTSTGELGNLTSKSAPDIVMHHKEGAIYQAVICPQEINENWYETLWLNLQVDGKHYYYNAPRVLDNGQEFKEFQEGKEVKLVINLTGLPSVAGQTLWVHGIQVPEVSTWGWAFINPYTPGLTWKREYGWYDCNKKEPETGHGNDPTSDSNLCWAASGSNLIYWWLDRNKEYIERYGKFDMDRWAYVDALNCPIFHYYNDHFDNIGNNVAAGINWFFTGKPANESVPGGGFFKEVIGNRNIVRVGGSGEYAFSRDLKYALLNKEAVELTHAMPTGTHAITLWGAEFDENDKVCAVYVCDNNDRTNDTETEESIDKNTGKPIVKIGLYRRKIAYQGGVVKMENSQGNCTIPINELNFLGTCEDLWKEYFRKNP